MTPFDTSHIDQIVESGLKADLKIWTLGRFSLELDGTSIPDNWGRDKSLQLFQFLLVSRNRAAIHKEQIIDRLWEEQGNDQDFKVALHGINKTLDPNKKNRKQARFIVRQGATYKLNTDAIWLDTQAMEALLEIGNNSINGQKELAISAFQYAVALYQGGFLPNRIYEDWTSAERERLQVLAMGGFISLAELLLEKQANESIRLTEEALKHDPTWEEAYRIQMKAHMNNGNRPQAIKTYSRCAQILEQEFGIEPLPDTKQLLREIKRV